MSRGGNGPDYNVWFDFDKNYERNRIKLNQFTMFGFPFAFFQFFIAQLQKKIKS